MAYSYVLLDGDGVTTSFNFNFGYLSSSHIHVTVDGDPVSFTFLTDFSVEIIPAPASGAKVEIRRKTPLDEPIVDWTDGTVLSEADLDLDTLFSLYAAQEAQDVANSAVLQDSEGVYDGQGRTTTNFADPEDPTGLVTRNYFENTYTPLLDAKVQDATTQANAASNAASQAQGYAIAADNSADLAAQLLGIFQGQYLGPHASPPTVDGNGNPVTVGDLYFDTVEQVLKVYSSEGWRNAGTTIEGTISTPATVIATDGQTVVPVPGGYDPGFMIVFVNGVRVTEENVDLTSGTNIEFVAPLNENDEVSWVAFGSFEVANAIPAENSVSTSKIQDGAVTNPKLASNAVSEAKIASGAVTTDKLGDASVTSGKLADNSVLEAKLANGAVTTNKLSDEAVSSTKLADGAVTTNKIADGSVTVDKLDPSISFDVPPGSITDLEVASNAAIQSTKLEYQAVGGGAVEQTVHDKLAQTVRVEDFGAVGDDLTNNRFRIENALNAGRKVELGVGIYQTTGTIEIDNSDITGEPGAGIYGRSLIGQGERHSVIRGGSTGTYPILSVIPSATLSHTRLEYERFSVQGGNLNQTGLKIDTAAFLRLSKLHFGGCGIGIDLVSCLSSSLRDIEFSWNKIGLRAARGDGFSNPNAILFENLNFRLNSEKGMEIQNPSNVQIIGGSIEGNGTMGQDNTGGLDVTFDGGSEGAAGLTIIGTYFELNEGGYDLRLTNTGSDYVTVTLINCNFNRASNTEYSTHNIRAQGKIRLNLIGCTFRGYNNYSYNSGRPHLSLTNGALLQTSSGCEFSSNIESPLGAPIANWAGFWGPGGAAAVLPDGWTLQNPSIGVVLVEHNLGTDQYAVTATALTGDNNQVQRIVKGINDFAVVTIDGAGLLVDEGACFNFTLLSRK